MITKAQFSVLTGEQRVNSVTAGEQWGYWWSTRTVAVQPDGGYIISFIDLNGLDGQAEGIYARMFNSDGTPKGPQFQVNTLTAGTQYSPTVAVAPDGSFVIGWEGPGSSIDVWAQRYTKEGVKISSQFLLSTTVSGNQRYPEIQFFQDGTWVAGFVDGGQTVLQKFDELGRPIGLETRISSGLGDVIMDGMCVRPDGTILMTWTTGQNVYGQIFSNSLQPIGSPTMINTFTAGLQEYCLARVDAEGNFVAVWESENQDGSGMGIFGRRFDSNFIPLSGEFPITTVTAGNQFEPQVAMSPGGRFVVVWSDNNNRDGGGGSTLLAGPGASVWMRSFSSSGTPEGSETMVNVSTTGYQAYPTVDMNASGKLLVSWEGNGTQTGQIDNYGVFARTYQLTQTGTTSITVAPVNVAANDLVTVTMTLTNPVSLPNVEPNQLSILSTNGVFATLVSGPTPAMATVGSSPVTFTWTYRVTANESTGELVFGGNAHTNTGILFPYAQSNTVSIRPSIFLSDLTAPNLIGDSNNPDAGPVVFTIGAKITNGSINELTNVMVYLGDGTTGGVFPVTTMTQAQTLGTYQGSFSLNQMSGASDYTRSLVNLGPAQPVMDGGIDFNRDGTVNGSDDGTLSNGKVVIDGRVDVDSNGTVTTADDLPRPAGKFYGWREAPLIDGYVDFNNDGIINTSDDGTYGGETQNLYWQVIYATQDAFGQPTFGNCGSLLDDLRYNWVIWATALENGIPRRDDIYEYAKVRCELSANANKISPGNAYNISSGPPRIIDGMVDINADGNITIADDGPYYGKVVYNGLIDINSNGSAGADDDGFLNSFPVIDGKIDIDRNGIINTADNAVMVLPGQTFTLTVHNADFGTIGQGFDENRDGFYDYDVWYQPIGESNWPATSFSLLDIQADVWGSGSTPLPITHYDNEPYLSQLVGVTQGGFNATYTYTFVAIAQGDGYLTPYQEAGSGADNEKYNGDYGTAGVRVLTGTSGIVLSKSSLPDVYVKICDEVTWNLTYSNTSDSPVGNPGSGNGVTIEDEIPSDLTYVGNSASCGTYPCIIYYSTDNGTTWLSSQPANPALVNRIRWSIDQAVPAGGLGSLSFKTTIKNCPAPGSIITNQAVVRLGTGPVISSVQDQVIISNPAPVISTCPVTRIIQGCGTDVITDPPFNTQVTSSSYTQFSNVTNMGVATDECAIVSVTYQDAVSGRCPINVLRTWTVRDCYQGVICVQTIQISDQTPPVITQCAPGQTINANVNCQSIVPDFKPGIIASDNCTSSTTLTITQSPAAGSVVTTGIHTIQLLVTDECGNQTSCTTTLTVIPVIDALDDNYSDFPVSSIYGGTAIPTVVSNDRLNCLSVLASNLTITLITPPTHGGIHFNTSTGAVTVDPGTPTGIYSLVYRICDLTYPLVCDQATATIFVSDHSAGGNKQVCFGTSVQMSAVGTGTWSLISGPGTAVITSPNDPDTFIGSLSSTGAYTFRWTSYSGITDDALVTVIGYPTLQLNSSTTFPVCSGTPFTITASTDGSISGWYSQPFGYSGPTTPITFNQGIVNSGTANIPVNFTVTAYDVSGTCATSLSFPAEIKPAPCLKIEPSNLIVCDFEKVVLTATPVIPGTTITWTASNGLVSINGNNGSIDQLFSTGNWTFTFTGTYNGCSCSNSVTVVVKN